jgi:homopolymeric O-antigen transport system permease protein
MDSLYQLYQYRDLMWLWIVRDVQVRYKQSLLGIGWAVLQPVALTLIFTLVFSRLVHIDTGGVPYPIFTYAALVPWTFFATSLSTGIPSLINNMNLVTKVRFPREILPLASIGSAFVDFLCAFAVFLVMLAIYGIRPSLHVFWLIPLLIVQITLTIGVTLLGGAAIVFFRDVRFVIPLLLQIWMYATPIIYPADLVPVRLRVLYFLNPMAGIIDGYRRIWVLDQDPLLWALALGAAVSLILLLISYPVFKRLEPAFADLI